MYEMVDMVWWGWNFPGQCRDRYQKALLIMLIWVYSKSDCTTRFHTSFHKALYLYWRTLFSHRYLWKTVSISTKQITKEMAFGFKLRDSSIRQIGFNLKCFRECIRILKYFYWVWLWIHNSTERGSPSDESSKQENWHFAKSSVLWPWTVPQKEIEFNLFMDRRNSSSAGEYETGPPDASLWKYGSSKIDVSFLGLTICHYLCQIFPIIW